MFSNILLAHDLVRKPVRSGVQGDYYLFEIMHEVSAFNRMSILP